MKIITSLAYCPACLTLKECAPLLHCTPERLRQLTQQGLFPAHRPPGRKIYIVDKRDLEAYIAGSWCPQEEMPSDKGVKT